MLATIEQATGGEQVSYVMQDHQGSTRVVTNQSGQVTSRHDYTPFGNEIGAGVGMRDTTQGYSQPTSVKQGYALTESDTNNLRHTWFRKVDSKQGRFTSPDPYNGSMSLGDPQSFNRYSYVENDPVNFIDPSGLNMAPGGGMCFTFEYGIDWTYPDGSTRRSVHGTFTICVGGSVGSSGGGGFLGGGGDSNLKENPAGDKDVTKCEATLASMFGESGASMRTRYDAGGAYRGFDPAARAAVANNPPNYNQDGLPSNPRWDAEHLYNFPHLVYGDGNVAGNIYVPSGFTSSTPPTQGQGITTFYYRQLGNLRDVTLAIFHVGDYGLQAAGGRTRIGTTGGTGGTGRNNTHSHFELWRGRGYRGPGPGRDNARIPFVEAFCRQ